VPLHRVRQLHELGEDVLEVAPAKNQEVVEALAPDGADPAFGERVRARAPVGSPGYPDGLTPEDLVERGGELGVAITQQELDREPALLNFPGEVACLLGDPRRRSDGRCKRRGGRGGCRLR
jgi:hypothetical protein